MQVIVTVKRYNYTNFTAGLFLYDQHWYRKVRKIEIHILLNACGITNLNHYKYNQSRKIFLLLCFCNMTKAMEVDFTWDGVGFQPFGTDGEDFGQITSNWWRIMER